MTYCFGILAAYSEFFFLNIGSPGLSGPRNVADACETIGALAVEKAAACSFDNVGKEAENQSYDN
jgi:hypothetical protein